MFAHRITLVALVRAQARPTIPANNFSQFIATRATLFPGGLFGLVLFGELLLVACLAVAIPSGVRIA